MIQWLKCHLLPWHKPTITGRVSITGQVWEARCSCGTRWAVKRTYPHEGIAIRAEEFEAEIGFAKPEAK